jgi:hypothetical protein
MTVSTLGPLVHMIIDSVSEEVSCLQVVDVESRPHPKEQSW